MITTDTRTPSKPNKPSGGFKTILLVVIITMVTTVAGVYLLNLYLFPAAFKPVTLTAQEKQVLRVKIQRLEKNTSENPGKTHPSTKNHNRSIRKTAKTKESGGPITPEPYRENPEMRKIRFTEREINALLAHNTDLADKLAIDLSEDLASAKLLIPLDPDFPILGGKTLRASAGLEIRIDEQKPVIKLRGISLWGIPLPNAWLGGIKNVNLINELGGNQGFWNAFAAGIKTVRIQEGNIFIELKN